MMDTEELIALRERATKGPFRTIPPADVLNDILRYDAQTGLFAWRFRGRQYFETTQGFHRWNGRFPGRPAFYSVNFSGYLYGSIFDVPYFAHRIAWAMTHNISDFDELDHINRNPLDNRLCNLRLASRSINARNKDVRSDSVSQVRGVRLDARYSTWQAYIRIDGRKVHLGSFVDVADAIAARKDAETNIGGGYG